MRRHQSDILVLGSGAAGLAAASKAKELGAEKVILLDEKEEIGGVLPQCIHPGFGLHYLNEDLTGPEFSLKLRERAESVGVEVHCSTYAMELSTCGGNQVVRAIAPEGIFEFCCKAVICATGARERHSFEIGVAGHRPAGVYTAGQAQTMMDLYGVMPGKAVVIIGSGDVGLIIARRFALQGAEVKAVIEMLPYPGGLARNVQQCLIDFGIPLYLSHRAVKILGRKRVKAITVAKVDESLRAVPETEFEMNCDTVVVSAGLIPRVELLERVGAAIDPVTRGAVVNEFLETSLPGVFAAGNALVINDLVDYAAIQGETAAKNAVDFIQTKQPCLAHWKPVVKGRNVRLVVPQYVSGERDVLFYGRVVQPEEDVLLKIPEIKAEFRQLRVRPSDMFAFKVSQRRFERLKNGKITIVVEPRE